MNSLKLILTILALMLGDITNAQDIGFYLGGDYSQLAAEGSFGTSENTTQFNFNNQDQFNLFIKIKHPLPFIPNVKIKYTTLDFNGETEITNPIEFNGVSYSGTISNTIDIDQTDFILFYSIISTDTFSLNLGISGRKLSGSFSVNELDIGKTQQDISEVLPMVYSSINIALPFKGFSVNAIGNYGSIDGHTSFDAEAALSYEVFDNVALNTNISIGYRLVKLELEDLDNIYSDLDFNGVFIGLAFKF